MGRGWGADPGSSKGGAAVQAVSAQHCIPEAAALGWWLALSEHLLEDWGAALGAELRDSAARGLGDSELKRLLLPKGSGEAARI